MSSDLFPPHLHLQAIEERRHQLLEMMSRCQQEHMFASNPKEQMRLERDIAEADTKLRLLELDITQQGLAEVRKCRSKQAYALALQMVNYLLADFPQHPELQVEQTLLQDLERQAIRIPTLITGLSRTQDEQIKAVRIAVATALKKPENSQRYRELVEQVECLLNKSISSSDFLFWWEAVFNNTDTTTHGADKEKLGIAQRIRTGSMVLFLGSGVAGNHAQESALAAQLAEQANYTPPSPPSLSAVAEYYRMKLDLGVARLLQNLQAILPQDAQQVGLYQQLAAVSARLILVSAAYDDLLEQAFMAASKPFVSLTSIIQQGQASVGQVVVSFSDDNTQAGVYPKEAISGLDLGRYSVIYKIKGSCRVTQKQTVRTDTLALSENDYFNFARHADKLMPDYLANEFNDKGFLFVGYHPRHWEDRLLASAVLKRRGFANEPCYRLAATGLEPLEEAFWQRSNVTQYAMNLPELEQYLQQGALA